MIRWNVSIAADDVVVGEHHALRRAGRARGEDELEDVGGGGRRPGSELGFPIGREGRVGFGGQGIHGGRREAIEAGLARVGGVTARAEDEMPGARIRDDAFDRGRRHAEVERDQDQPGPHGPEIGRGEFRHRRRPGQQPVAAFKAEGAESPRGDPGSSVEFAVAPGRRRPVVKPKTQGGLVAVGGDGLGEQIEQGVQDLPSMRRRHIVRRRHRGLVTCRASGQPSAHHRGHTSAEDRTKHTSAAPSLMTGSKMYRTME